jgi:hypothetical protein
MQIKKGNNRSEIGPDANRLGNILPATLVDEAINLRQFTVDSVNHTYSGNNTSSGTETFTNTTESTSSTTGSVKTAGGLGVVKNLTIGGQAVFSKNIIQNHTPYTAGTDTTAGWTLTEVKTGLVAGCIKTTSAAAVTLTLDSVANIITAFATAGVTLGAGSIIQFIVDNTSGANTVTVAVDSGATIAIATPVLTGGATLTLSTANKVGVYQLYIYSATAGILSRLV